MYYIKKDRPISKEAIIISAIEKIIGKRSISMGFTDGKLRELEIDDKGISASKKKELQNYVDTLKNE